MTSQARQGGCLCGSVRYRFTGEPSDLSYCHCRMCQRAGGAPIVAWATVPGAAFAWTGTPPRTFRSSGSARRFFCGECGSPLAFQADDQLDQLDLTIASLDDPATLAPQRHTWVTSRVPWFDTSDRLPRYAEGSHD
jgi:hypothetical protein